MDHDQSRSADRLASQLGLWADGPGALYVLLAGAVADLIETGVIRAGEVLPPERRLAAALSVSRGTVVSAYGLLVERGLVERIRGSGTRVVGDGPALEVGSARIGDPLFATAGRAINLLVAVPRIRPAVVDLVDSVSLADHRPLLDDEEPAGIAPLRQAIAARLTADGVPTTHHQVIATAGAQQATVLAVALLVGPGDVVVHEDTTWPGLIDAVRRFGGRPQGITMDEDGLVVDELRSVVDRQRPVLVALNPHHHNPTGTRLTPRRRAEVAAVAVEYGVPVLEDRVMARLAFDGQVPPPLAADGPAHLHLTVDSVNKIAWPGLRLGWIRADAQMVAQLRSLRAMLDLYSSIPSQLAALRILDACEGIVDDRIGELRTNAEIVVTRLRELVPSWRFTPPRGGLAVWLELPHGSASAFCAHAARFGVLVAGGRQFGSVADDRHLRIPFTASPAELDEAVRRLAAAWTHFDPDAVMPLAPATIM